VELSGGTISKLELGRRRERSLHGEGTAGLDVERLAIDTDLGVVWWITSEERSTALLVVVPSNVGTSVSKSDGSELDLVAASTTDFALLSRWWSWWIVAIW